MKNYLFALLVAGSIAGCAVPGERAGQAQCTSGECTTSCPSGEVCSDDTPQGLYFGGAPVFDRFDGGPRTIAVGGTESFAVFVSSSLETQYDGSFDAEGTGPFEVTEVDPPAVTVHADAVKDGYLRVLEPGSDKLYDRIALHAAEVQSITFTPAQWVWVQSVEPKGWALFAGEPVALGVRLRGADLDDAVVDESMVVAAKSGVIAGKTASSQWDMISVVPEAGGEVSLVATLGNGTAQSQSFPVTEKIDSITPLLQPDEKVTLAPSAQTVLCFRALSGDLAVAGVPWKFSAAADVTLDTDAATSACVFVQATKIGPHVLTVEAGGAVLAFAFDIVQSAAPGKSKGPKPWSKPKPVAMAGERSAGE